MKNNFLQEAYGGLREARSKHYCLGLPRQWKVITFTLLLLFTFAIGNVWAACPEAGTIFKFATKSSLSGNTNITDNPVAITTENYLASFEGTTGSSLTAHNEGKKFQIASNGMKLADGAKSYLILNLGECTLKAGDIVKIKVTSQNVVLSTTENKSDAFLTIVKNNNEQTLSIENDVDESTIYLVTASNGAIVYSLEIIRPYTITLDAATNGGTVSKTTVKGAEGDKVVLPHAFKSGYKFKGWYTAASGGTKQANLYTVSDNTTLVAQFEDLPVSGEMFSLSMKSELKPAANCTLKNAAGFAQEIDLLTYATIEGGAAFFRNTSSNNHAIITDAGALNFNGSNAVMEIPLDFALQNGDEIQTDFSNKVWLSAATTKPSSGPYVDGSNKTYIIIESDGLKNATTLYLYTGTSGATATSIVITRPVPAATHTLNSAVDPAGKGTVTLGESTVAEGATTTATYSAIDPLYEFDEWQISGTGASIDNAKANPVTVTMGTDDAVVTLKLKPATTKYDVTAATGLAGGSVVASAATEAEGETVTITATPAFRYLFSAWDVYKTADPTTKVDVTETAGVYTFEMPAYDVTVSASFTADSRKQILYLTTAATGSDKLYAALNAEVTYNVIVEAPASQTLTNYDLVVLHESIDGKSAAASDNTNKKQVILDIPTTTIPVLNTKSYFYTNSGTKRWDWGAPNNGDAAQKVATLNTSYSNIADHPIFDEVTITANTVKVLTDDVTSGNTMQPIGTFTAGKEGYTLATTPNKDDDPTPDGCAIHELTPTQRGVASGKYLMISVSNVGLNNLTADGQKLFKNAAAYLLDGEAAWVPAAAATDDATLKALSVSGLTLSPTFAAATVDYTVTKAYGAADPVVGNVTATPTADGADVDVAWDGTNKKFTITVTALNNTTEKTYTITVNEAEAPKSLSRVLFSNGFDAFIDNTNHTVKAYYLSGAAEPTATTITAGEGTAGALSEGKIRVTGEDDSYVDYVVTLEAVTPNTTTVAEEAAAGEFAGDEAWVKNGLLVYGNAAGYSAGDKWYVNRRLKKGTDPENDQRVIAGWVRSYFFVGNASKFIMTIGGNKKLDYTIDGGTPVENVNTETLEIALTKGNHMIEIVSHQSDGDCRLSAPKLVELPPSHTVTYKPGEGSGAWVVDDDAIEVADVPGTFTAPTGKVFNGWKNESDDSDVEVGAAVATDMNLIAQWINHYAVTFNMNDHGDAIDPQDIKEGAKATKPADPVADGFDFGGWFTDNGTFEAPFDFNTSITAATPLYAKWTADPCPTPFSLSKVVLTSATDGTVTGYNGNEYAGEKVIGGLKDDGKTADITGDAAEEKGYKLNSGGSSIVFATLKKGEFQAGDRVTVGVIYQNTNRTVDAATNILTIYAGSDKDHTLEIATLTGVSDPGFYTYRLKAADITAINAAGYKGIGVFRASDNGQNHSIYSVEIQGCRSFAEMHTLTFKNFDGTATIAAEPLEEGVYASTVVPADPKITLKRFLGWAEAVDGTPVDLTTYTITEDKTLYAVYEDIVCPTKGTVFSMDVTDPAGTEYDGNNEFVLEIGATYVGGKAYSGSKNATNRKGAIDTNGEYSFAAAGDVTIKIEMECALHEGDTISFTTSTTRELKIQKVAGTDLVVTSGKKYIIPAESPLIGVYEFYLERGNSESTMKTLKVTRPAVYDVTFNMMGHGDQVAAIEDVLDGHKIAAPSPAPTDADYRFGGWYKENTHENEWDFDNDVVTDNITLYAKWVDKSDATLKSLKYGTTEIALEAGVYTYAVNLSPLATDVPALTAVPSNPSATAVVTNAAALDSEGHATSTVLVTPEEGGSPQTYTVNFTKLHIYTELADVTETTSWNWNGVATDEVKINDVAVRGLILANYIDAPNFEKLEGQENARAYRSNTYPAYQGTYLRFHATKPGRLTMNVRNSSGSPKLYVNGGDPIATLSSDRTDYNVIVPAGDVIITSTDGEMRIYNMTYKLLEELTPDYTRDVTEGRFGTICLPNGGVMVGAELFEIAYYGATSEKIFFDNIPSGEMEAGIPYIFLPKAGVSQLGVFYTDAADAPAGSKNGLIGSYTQAPITANAGNYILLNNQYCEVVTTAEPVYVGANRAYIKLSAINPTEPALAPGRRRISMGVQSQNAATGMDELNASETPVKMLIDGQLFILRGEKMYNANGQLVK